MRGQDDGVTRAKGKGSDQAGAAAREKLWGRLWQLAGLGVVAAAVSSASCGKTNNYEYIDVNVFADTNTVSKADFASQVAACEMYVTGSEVSNPVGLPCMPTLQSYPNVGTFEWRTALNKGSLQFTVTLFALNHVPFAVGTSDPVVLGTGQNLTSNVVAVLVPSTTPGTGGTTGGTGGASGTGGISGAGGGNGGTTGLGGAAGESPGSGGTSGAGGSPGTGGAGGSAGGSAGHGGAPGSGGGAGGSTTGAGGSAGGAGAGGAGGS